jgi:hypothetical protein
MVHSLVVISKDMTRLILSLAFGEVKCSKLDGNITKSPSSAGGDATSVVLLILFCPTTK